MCNTNKQRTCHYTHTHTHAHVHAHTRTHAHPFNGPLSGTTQVSQYQKGKTNLDFTEARDSEWQWHQLGHMQVCTSLQTDNNTSTSQLSFYRPDALPSAQPTASKHWRKFVPLMHRNIQNLHNWLAQSAKKNFCSEQSVCAVMDMS